MNRQCEGRSSERETGLILLVRVGRGGREGKGRGVLSQRREGAETQRGRRGRKSFDGDFRIEEIWNGAERERERMPSRVGTEHIVTAAKSGVKADSAACYYQVGTTRRIAPHSGETEGLSRKVRVVCP